MILPALLKMRARLGGATPPLTRPEARRASHGAANGGGGAAAPLPPRGGGAAAGGGVTVLVPVPPSWDGETGSWGFREEEVSGSGWSPCAGALHAHETR